MRQITFITLAFALLIVSYSQEVQAQYVSSAQARELLQELQDARSVTNVGISRLEYGKVVRNIQIKLDRFLRTSDASKHPVGYNLQSVAWYYIQAYNEDGGTEIALSMAGRQLEITEKCVVNTKLSECESIISANERKARDAEFYNLLVSKNSSYESLLESIEPI